MQVVLTGWPEHKQLLPQEAQAYFTSHDKLSVQDGLLFKNNWAIIPASLHHQIIHKIHSSHVGIEGSLCRNREAYYRPLMNTGIKDSVAKYSICNTLRPEQCHEELNTHKLSTRPWSKVGTDLFTLNGKNYIVTVDYYSNFIEMDGLNSTISKTVIETRKRKFTRHGIPDVLVLDNSPRYSSDEFQ